MFMCLLIWVCYFAAFGNFIFEANMEGVMVFDNFWDSYYNMFVCLTTENYPDVMLIAQYDNAFYCLFFVIFILGGVFFL